MRTLCGLVLAAAILCLGAAIATSRVNAAEIYASRVFSVDETVYAVRFSPAGDRVALATDAGTIIFDTLDGKQVAELKGKASSVAWSPNGSVLMVATADALRFWNVADYSKELAAIPGMHRPSSLAFPESRSARTASPSSCLGKITRRRSGRSKARDRPPFWMDIPLW